jgi:thymidylate synthase
MLLLKADSASVLYHNCCKALTNAEEITARGLKTKEIIGFRAELTSPQNRLICNPSRALDKRYLVGELCYFLAGRTDLSSIYYYSKFWAKVSDDGETVNSAYGHRLFYDKNAHKYTQLDYVLDMLKEDPYSRKAVMPIYGKDNAYKSSDNPCTMFLQFFIRDNALECHTFMRSNDIWLGFPYDIAFFTLVQEIVFMALKHYFTNLRLGSYFHNVTSMHAYERDWLGVSKCSEPEAYQPEVQPSLTTPDISNWFNDLLTFEKAKRGVVLYKKSGFTTPFQDWCKAQLVSNKEA